MTRHGALSVVVTIRPGMTQRLGELFKQMEAEGVETNSKVPFRQISSIHFARFVLLPGYKDANGEQLADKLAFTTNYDLPVDNHLNQLADKAGKGLWEIFSMCAGFPASEAFNREKLIAWLRDKNIPANTFYVGVGYRSVQQIENECRLREAIEIYADNKQDDFNGKYAVSIRNTIIAYVNSKPEFEWAKKTEPKESTAWRISYYGKLILVILAVLALSPLILPFVITWWLMMLFIEISEKDIPQVLTKEHLRELVVRETNIVQTQFSAYGDVKPGIVRKLTMLFLLKMTNFLAPYLFSKGKLSGIPTVHFARWIIINKGKQMLFLSNFDGRSEGYLRDFINIAAKQLTLMFCHTIGYPKTRLMVFGGAKDAKGFMEWARNKQVITNIWYSANKTLTVKNIYNNSAIRDGLYGEMNEQEARKWLKLL